MSLVLDNVQVRAGTQMLRFSARLGGGCTGIFGPSGAGKTTLIELVAGLRRPVGGRIMLDDVTLDDAASQLHRPPERRQLGYVPQDGALFPHLSVEGNLRYGAPRSVQREAFSVLHICALLELESLLARTISTLSGGEKQRVAIGRALLTAPRLLLLDEPLASLDDARKETILPYLRRVRDELRVPLLYVSHSADELLALCDDLAVVVGGQIVQHGPIGEVFHRPAGPAVARLVGVETVQPARVLGCRDGLATVAIGTTSLIGLAEALPAGTTRVLACIRAEEVLLMKSHRPPTTSARNCLPATIRALVPDGVVLRVELDCGFPLSARLTRLAVLELGLTVGDSVYALVKAPAVHLIPSDTAAGIRQ